MIIILTLVGMAAWLMAVIAILSMFTGGTDIQLIAAGVYGTFGAICLGLAAILEELRRVHKTISGDSPS